MFNRSNMLEIIPLVIFTISLVEFSQALISCNKNNVTKIQLCLMNNDSLDINVYPDVEEYRDPLIIKTTLTLISIAEVCLPQNS